MKTQNLKRLSGIVLAGCLGMLQAPTVFAAAGDTIGNTATLNYQIGGTPQTLIESDPGGNSNPGLGNGGSTDFIEDRVINFTVAEVGNVTTSVAPDATLQVQTFTVTNNGNGTQDFLFSALDRTTGTADPWSINNDNQDVASAQVFVETVNAGFDTGDDTSIFADQVPPLGSVTVYIVSTIPDDTVVSDGDIMVMSLVAQVADGSAASADDSIAANAGAAITNDDNNQTSPTGTYNNGATVVAAGTANNVADTPLTEDVVFNDTAGTLDSDNNADVARNGQHSDDDSYTVTTADLTVTKLSQVLWDPVNLAVNPKAIPGAYVTYTVTIANAGTASASAELTTISDALQPAGVGFGTLTLDPDFITNAGPGNPTSTVAGDAIQIDTTGTSRPSAGISYCTGDIAPGDGDGCDYTGGVAGTVTILNNTVAGIAAMAAEVGYTAGELAPGDTIVYRFNVIVQ